MAVKCVIFLKNKCSATLNIKRFLIRLFPQYFKIERRGPGCDSNRFGLRDRPYPEVPQDADDLLPFCLCVDARRQVQDESDDLPVCRQAGICAPHLGVLQGICFINLADQLCPRLSACPPSRGIVDDFRQQLILQSQFLPLAAGGAPGQNRSP